MSVQKIGSVILLGAILIVFAACGTAPTDTPETPTSNAPDVSIILGDVSDDPGEVIEGTQPLADYLAANLADHGITSGSVTVAASTDEMASLLETGQVDLYFDSVYPATLISDETGAQVILRRWRFGVEEYNTVIFASVESGIQSIEDLPGRMIAFDSPYSTSGYALPAVTLIDAGLTLAGRRTYGEPVQEDEVGFVFSYDDENTLLWVLDGLVDAGATDDYHWDVLFTEETRDQLVFLAETESVPRQVVIARPGMDPDLLDAVVDVLTGAHETEEGQAALESFQTTRFDEFPEGIEAALDRMREMMETVQAIPAP